MKIFIVVALVMVAGVVIGAIWRRKSGSTPQSSQDPTSETSSQASGELAPRDLAPVELEGPDLESHLAKSQDLEGRTVESMVVELSVALLGGELCRSFQAELHTVGLVNAVTTSHRDVFARAALIASAEAVIIVVDATQGPLPINREDIILSRQFSLGPVMIGFAQSAQIEGTDLEFKEAVLKLEELEIRELLKTYDLPGDLALVVFDALEAPTRLTRGCETIARILAKIQVGSRPLPIPIATQQLEVLLYVFKEAEVFTRGITMIVQSGTYQLIFGQQIVNAELVLMSPIQPGEKVSAVIHLLDPIDTLERRRFIIANQDHVIIAGAVIKT